jgi:hypothetical protein
VAALPRPTSHCAGGDAVGVVPGAGFPSSRLKMVRMLMALHRVHWRQATHRGSLICLSGAMP